MTLMKEKAVEMIRRMPEDNMTYVINILQNLEAMSVDRAKDRESNGCSQRYFEYGKKITREF